MHEQLAEILYYIKATIRYKWLILIVTWLICIPGWFYIAQMPDEYTSTARVQVDTRTMLRPLMRGLAIQSDVRGLIGVMKQLMSTRQNLEKIAELAGSDISGMSESQRLEIVGLLKSGVKIEGGRDEIFSISYDASNAQRAKQVVQAVLTIFSEETQKSAMSDADSAQRFLLTQIQEYEQRLRNAEKARENFKRANIGMLPGTGTDQAGQMQALQLQIEESQAELMEFESKKQVLTEQLKEAQETSEEWGLTGLDNPMSSVSQEIAQLKKQRDELLMRYTHKHPNVRFLDKRIQTLAKRQEKNNNPESSGTYIALSNPYVQTIKVALNELEAQIASLISRIKNQQDKMAQLDDQYTDRLRIETEMQNLNRDYEAIKANYNTLLTRREEASMSEKMDNQSTALRFKIADPPNKPLAPSGPKRMLFNSAVMGAGLVAGIGLAFLLVLLKPTFVSSSQVRQVTGFPVLGSITLIKNKQELARARVNITAFLILSLLLFVVYGGVMVFKS